MHEDLNRVRWRLPYEEFQDREGEAEVEKAGRAWVEYARRNDSPVTDLFCGQLQSNVRCHSCDTTFTCYDPFWDLSVPIPKVCCPRARPTPVTPVTRGVSPLPAAMESARQLERACGAGAIKQRQRWVLWAGRGAAVHTGGLHGRVLGGGAAGW